MKNRIFKNKHGFMVDDGADAGPRASFTWDDGRLVVSACGELRMTHKTIRELTKWMADTQIKNQQKGGKCAK